MAIVLMRETSQADLRMEADGAWVLLRFQTVRGTDWWNNLDDPISQTVNQIGRAFLGDAQQIVRLARQSGLVVEEDGLSSWFRSQ